MSQVSSQGELHECPWSGCHGFYPLVGREGNRVVKVHSLSGKPCPGGGFNVDKPMVSEIRKMVKRAQGTGLA